MKVNWTPTPNDQFVFSYTRNQQDNGKRYDQLLGGDGNLIADLRDLMLDFFYAKYNRADVGSFDQVTATYSFNTQREERVNQGGNGNPTALDHPRVRADVLARIPDEGHLERSATARNCSSAARSIRSTSRRRPTPINPVTGATTVRRGRVPDGATLPERRGSTPRTPSKLVPGKLRLVGDLRYSGAHYRVVCGRRPGRQRQAAVARRCGGRVERDVPRGRGGLAVRRAGA